MRKGRQEAVEETLYLLASPAGGNWIVRRTVDRFRRRGCACHALNAVHRLNAGFKVSAHQEFADKTHRKQLHTEEREHHAEDEQGAVLHEDRGAEQNLFCKQDGKYPATCDHAEESGWAKEVERARHIAEEEAYREQIEEDPESARDSVVRLAAGTNDILDRHFDDFRAVEGCERGNEAVHFAIQADVLDDFAAIDFEGSAEIVDVDSGEFGHHPVGNTRRQAAHDEIVHALLAPAADDVAASGFKGFQHYRDVVRVVLQVAVHGDDDFAGSVVKTGGEGGGLAVIALEAGDGDARIIKGNLAENLRSRVAALIVHINELDGFEAASHHTCEAGMEFADAFLFVVKRDDDRIFRTQVAISQASSGVRGHYKQYMPG